MKGQKIGKKCQQKELNWMCKTDQKTRNYIILSVRQCPTGAKKIKYAKLSYYSEDNCKRKQIKQNFYSCTLMANIKKQRKIKANDTM